MDPMSMQRPLGPGGYIAVVGIVAAALLASIGAREASAVNPIVNINLFTQADTRALAMGNAFGAVARGEGALLYNPAGLVLFNYDIKAEYSAAFQGSGGAFAQETYALLGGIGGSAPPLATYLANYQGTTQGYNFQTFGSAVANLGHIHLGLGAGNLDSHRYSIGFDPYALTAGVGLHFTDEAVQMQNTAIAFKIMGGKTLLGISAKTVAYSKSIATVDYSTAEAAGNITPTFTSDKFPTATLYDVGIISRSEFWPRMRPQISITAYNLGGGTLTGATSSVDIPASYNLGLALGPETPVIHWILSFELEDVTSALGVWDGAVNQPRSAAQRFHAGFELGLIRTPTGNNVLNVRAGMNGTGVTYGWELNLWSLRLGYVSGQQDLGHETNSIMFNFSGYHLGLAMTW